VSGVVVTRPVVGGQSVIYRGSLTSVHGPATLVGGCDCDGARAACDRDLWEPAPRAVLRLPDGRFLLHVRWESFHATPQSTPRASGVAR
jgi:hypothetical protein